MTNPEILKRALLTLYSLQLQLDKNGGPMENGKLFEDYILLSSNILSNLGLPDTKENLEILFFDGSPSETELTSIVKLLHQAAENYLLSPPRPPAQVLQEARRTEANPFNILPELGISTNTYSMFVYQHVLLHTEESAEKIWQALQIANQPKIVAALGNFENTDFDKANIGVGLLKEAGVLFLDEFINYVESEVAMAKPGKLEEFWKAIHGEIRFKTLEERFDSHAYFLMNYICLVAGDHPYRITECEFYYNDGGTHSDPYTHGRSEQLFPGNWYFNDMGIDLTFGDHDKKIFASILIRGVRSLRNDQNINGPSKVLRELFNRFGNVIDGNNRLCLREVKAGLITIENPIRTTRVGLTRRPDDNLGFINKPYRYIVDLKKEHKFEGKERIVRQLVASNEIDKDQIFGILGYNLKFE